jgi:hypothetical protein
MKKLSVWDPDLELDRTRIQLVPGSGSGFIPCMWNADLDSEEIPKK